ncbi:hypothetical protein Taro_012318 [Colocasia esculenta]|uniref:Uncharacterized protein n=1 Tax=Colocasia esculenta TaxID=4460 RepID=A0A843U8E1_COLES|nr:hypothetical protein [Colocasia esculenta]
MVCGARSGVSSGRGLRGRVLFQASASGSLSVPPSGEFTPPQSRGPGSGQSTHSPNTVVVRCQRMLLVSRREEAIFMRALYGRCGSMVIK